MKNTLKPLPSFEASEPSDVEELRCAFIEGYNEASKEPRTEGDTLQITYQVGVQDGKEIMRKELSDLRDELNYYKGESLRLTDRNNQLKQAVAALNGEPTNSL